MQRPNTRRRVYTLSSRVYMSSASARAWGSRSPWASAVAEEAVVLEAVVAVAEEAVVVVAAVEVAAAAAERVGRRGNGPIRRRQ
jgi:hypothetical protein